MDSPFTLRCLSRWGVLSGWPFDSVLAVEVTNVVVVFRFIDGREANLAETEAAWRPIRMDDGDGGREA